MRKDAGSKLESARDIFISSVQHCISSLPFIFTSVLGTSSPFMDENRVMGKDGYLKKIITICL